MRSFAPAILLLSLALPAAGFAATIPPDAGPAPEAAGASPRPSQEASPPPSAAPAPQAPEPPPPPAPATPATPPGPGAASRLFYGGGLGLSFGTVDYVEIAPMIGVKVTPRTHLGVSLLYRYRSDDRFDPNMTTSDYGGSLFARWFAYHGLFVQGEYEYVNYEYWYDDGSTERQGDSNLLAGAGFAEALGGHASFYVSAMYNFSYDDNDPFEPYASPWVVRLGVGIGF